MDSNGPLGIPPRVCYQAVAQLVDPLYYVKAVAQFSPGQKKKVTLENNSPSRWEVSRIYTKITLF
jgi:hypothetical protein